MRLKDREGFNNVDHTVAVAKRIYSMMGAALLSWVGVRGANYVMETQR